jgi:hypothetical protein
MDKISVRVERVRAWKKNFLEKIGRDHISTSKNFIVAGCILDIIDEIWDRNERKIAKAREEFIKRHYNVYVYQMLPYPPDYTEKKRFIM